MSTVERGDLLSIEGDAVFPGLTTPAAGTDDCSWPWIQLVNATL
jgi:hypothetical protein